MTTELIEQVLRELEHQHPATVYAGRKGIVAATSPGIREGASYALRRVGDGPVASIRLELWRGSYHARDYALPDHLRGRAARILDSLP